MPKHAAQPSNNDEGRYPLIIRIYGVLSILGGGIQVLIVALGAFALFQGEINLSELEGSALTTTVVRLVELVLSTANAVMFVILGVRLLRGNRHKVALLANIMIIVEIGVLVCQVMLNGMDMHLAPGMVNIVILLALETYSDPALRDERRLQRHLRELEERDQAEEGTLGRDTTGKGYITLNFYNLFWVFVVSSVIGLFIEIVYHMLFVDPGHYQDRAGILYGPFSPIYGVGAVLMTIVLNRFYKSNFVVIFLVSALIGGAFEFTASWFFETAFGITAWDYTGTFLSIGGRTNGMFMAMWGVLGTVWIKFLLPYVLKLVNMIPWNLRYTVTAVATVFMAVNIGLTLAAFDCWFQRTAGTMDYKNASAIVQFCNENYNDSFMEKRFQSMDIKPDNAARTH